MDSIPIIARRMKRLWTVILGPPPQHKRLDAATSSRSDEATQMHDLQEDTHHE